MPERNVGQKPAERITPADIKKACEWRQELERRTWPTIMKEYRPITGEKLFEVINR